MASNLHPLMAAICEDFLAAPKVLREAQAGGLSHDPSTGGSEKAWPDSPERVIAFVGSNFNYHHIGNPPMPLDEQTFELSVHDLLSAFYAWFDRPSEADRTPRPEATARIDLWDQAVYELAKARETGADATTLRRLESAEEMARDAVYEARDIEPRPLFGEDE